jgi:nucleoside triphosphate pyrophosphatase
VGEWLHLASEPFDLIIAIVRLVLASGSPRRADLLRAAGYEFEIVVTDVDESIRPGEEPEAYVRRLAAEKSAAAQQFAVQGGPEGPSHVRDDGPPHVRDDGAPRAREQPIILGADTVVVVDGEMLGKPGDDAQAAAMLRLLSGKRHMVMTGVSLRQGAYELGRVEQTAVHFRALSAAEVAWYVASGEGRDKAGAYAIQGLASRFIPRIDGSYSNVVGLPVAAVAELLTSLLASRL